MVDVHALEESMVQYLWLGDQQQTDEDIQKKLDEVFKGQDQAWVTSFNLLSSIVASRSKILLEMELSNSFLEGYQKDTKWIDILQEYQLDPKIKAIIQGWKNNRLSHYWRNKTRML